MATRSNTPGSLMEELRSIRDNLNKKLLAMSPEERIAYINSLGKIDPTKKVKAAKPVTKRRRPTTKQRA